MRSEPMIPITQRVPDDAFAALLSMFIEADPWNFYIDRTPIEDFLDMVSRERGYCDWIEALHRFGR